MNILFCCNQAFIEHIKTLIYSVSINNNIKLNVYLMFSNISNESINDLESFINNKCNSNLYKIKVDSSLMNDVPKTNKEGNKYFGAEAYYRLFAQFFLPSDIDRVLYMDIDTICKKSFINFYNMDFDGKSYIACRDMGISDEHLKELQLTDREKYINSGILLINLDKLRKGLSMNEICNFAMSKKNVIEFADQDVINPLYLDDIKIISNEYNYTLHADLSSINEKDVSIVHYSGIVKGWGSNVYKLKIKYINLYYKYYKASRNHKISFSQIKHCALRFLYVIYVKIKKIFNL